MEDGRVRGVVFESKEGRMAIRAEVVVDATGDGDLFARAGAAFDNDIEEADVHHCMNTSWMFGGVDMKRWLAFRGGDAEGYADFMARGRERLGFFERPFVSWRNDIALFMGPRQTGYSAPRRRRPHRGGGALAPRDGRAPATSTAPMRRASSSAYLMLSAPQIGVRHSAASARRRRGAARDSGPRARALPDEIGVTPAVSPKFPNISVPYGALVPHALDGLLACGRHVSCDAQLARLHARDPAVLDHRAGRRHGRGAGGQGGRGTAPRGGGRTAGCPARPGCASAARGARGGRRHCEHRAFGGGMKSMPMPSRADKTPTRPAAAAVSRSDTVGALDRGLAILHCFSEAEQRLGPTELARLTGIPRPSVTRLAATLVAHRLLRVEPEGERFMLGAGVMALAQVFLGGLDLRATARAAMQQLAEATGGSVYLAIRDGLDMVLVEACRARSSIFAARLDVGSRAPLPNSALGRAYLASVDPSTREALVASLGLSGGQAWVAQREGLERALEEHRRRGWCLSVGEFHPEINSVSVAMRDARGEIVAFNCGGPAFTFTETRLRSEVGPALRAMVQALATEAGGTVPAIDAPPRSGTRRHVAPASPQRTPSARRVVPEP